MKVRGIRLGICHPIQSLEYILVPLLMRALKISEELSVSAMTRGIDSPDPKLNFKEMKFCFGDFIVMLGLIMYMIIIFYQKIFGFFSMFFYDCRLISITTLVYNVIIAKNNSKD